MPAPSLAISLALVAVAASGCGRVLRGAASIPNNPGIRIVPDGEARGYAKKVVPLEVPFGTPGNGTKLVADILQVLEARGAKYVSGLTFYMIYRLRGVPIECRTEVVFARDAKRMPAAPAAPAAPPPAPPADGEEVFSTQVSPIRPASVKMRVTEPELRCRKVGEQVKKLVPAYDSPFDVEVRSAMSGPMPMKQTIEIEWHDECDMETITRDVTRFDYQVRLGWVPPDWGYISDRWADADLQETEPSCYRIDEQQVADLPAHRLHATVFFVGRMPDNKFPLTPLQQVNAP